MGYAVILSAHRDKQTGRQPMADTFTMSADTRSQSHMPTATDNYGTRPGDSVHHCRKTHRDRTAVVESQTASVLQDHPRHAR